ncbi:MAG: hypothetical protein IIZ35_03510, partial [Clostridia bacterium]|nr:hypothetical protein [Clostridia bacterium]
PGEKTGRLRAQHAGKIPVGASYETTVFCDSNSALRLREAWVFVTAAQRAEKIPAGFFAEFSVKYP